MEYYNYIKIELEDEMWKDVIGWEEFYEVSNFGRIRTKERIMCYDKNLGRGKENKKVTKKIRKPKLNKHTGYLMVGLNGKGKSINVTIHSMVARAFIKNYESKGIGKGECVNHINGKKLDNRLINLEVVSTKENIRHAFENGLIPCHKIEYKGKIYYSKSEFRRQEKISEKKMFKMINENEIKILKQ